MGDENPSQDFGNDHEKTTVHDEPFESSDVVTVTIGKETVDITPDTTVGQLRQLPDIDADPDDVLSVVGDDGRLNALTDDSTRVLDHVKPGARLGFHPPFDKTDVGHPPDFMASRR